MARWVFKLVAVKPEVHTVSVPDVPTQEGKMYTSPEKSPSAEGTYQRLDVVDALRALALLGIVSVNVWFFADPAQVTGAPTLEPESSADQLTCFASTFIFEGKSYVIFSFLFGLSFVLAWASANRRGLDERRMAFRRLTALIIMGIAHGFFLFMGDILLAYGILGFLLFAMRKVSVKAALIVAGSLFAAGALFLLAGGALIALMDSVLEGTDQSGFEFVDGEDLVEFYSGSLLSYLGFQLIAYPIAAFSILMGQGVMVFGCFLVGLVVGRSRVIERFMQGGFSTPRSLWLGVSTLVVGGALSFAGAVMSWGLPGGEIPEAGSGYQVLGQGLAVVAGPIQSTGYVVLLLLAFRSGAFDWLLRVLAPAGRMSLTNYLTQSLVLMIIFSGAGFGLAGDLNAGAVGVIVLSLWLAQLVFSHLWFMRFTYGPVEIPFRAWIRKEPKAKPVTQS